MKDDFISWKDHVKATFNSPFQDLKVIEGLISRSVESLLLAYLPQSWNIMQQDKYVFRANLYNSGRI